MILAWDIFANIVQPIIRPQRAEESTRRFGGAPPEYSLFRHFARCPSRLLLFRFLAERFDVAGVSAAGEDRRLADPVVAFDTLGESEKRGNPARLGRRPGSDLAEVENA